MRERDDPIAQQAGIAIGLSHVPQGGSVDRLYTEARLQVKRRRRKKVPVGDRQPLLRPQRCNDVWTAQFRHILDHDFGPER